MKKSGRYNTSTLAEDQYEPESRGRVLKNLLGINRKRDMDERETQEQMRTFQELLRVYSLDHRFTIKDICRMHKLGLGDIGGIPRVLDAGQCNDSYSLVVIAQALAEAFGLEDINDLPVSYDIAWYEQKAVIVLLALLALGVKHIRLGPTLPAFLSPNVTKVLVENFDIKPISSVQDDVAAIVAGQ